jgi:hypothetical protein
MRDNASLPTKHGISGLFDLTVFKITSATSKERKKKKLILSLSELQIKNKKK